MHLLFPDDHLKCKLLHESELSAAAVPGRASQDYILSSHTFPLKIT